MDFARELVENNPFIRGRYLDKEAMARDLAKVMGLTLTQFEHPDDARAYFLGAPLHCLINILTGGGRIRVPLLLGEEYVRELVQHLLDHFLQTRCEFAPSSSSSKPEVNL